MRRVLVRQTDGAFAFRLRALPASLLTLPATVGDIAEAALEPADAKRFNQSVLRWGGPEDEIVVPPLVRTDSHPYIVHHTAIFHQPYAGQQLVFEPRAWSEPVDLEAVLRGAVQVHRCDATGRVDYILRDHHMVDVVLCEYAVSGYLPTSLFHADRHSDWCNDATLRHRPPDQAATWWSLLGGLKRPPCPADTDGDNGGDDVAAAGNAAADANEVVYLDPAALAPVLAEEDIIFTTAKAAHQLSMSGRDVGAHERVPPHLGRADLPWAAVRMDPRVAAHDPGAATAAAAVPAGGGGCVVGSGSGIGSAVDFVSVDLDYLLPAAQFACARPMLADARFRKMLQVGDPVTTGGWCDRAITSHHQPPATLHSDTPPSCLPSHTAVWHLWLPSCAVGAPAGR
jgi:hypothetical protein